MIAEEKTGGFQIKYMLAALAVLLFILSIFSYSSADLAVLDGGAVEPIRNWIGPFGAHVSRAFFYIFGVATYPIVFLLILCVVRSFMPYPLKRRGYIPSLLVTILGITLLFAMFPREFVSTTSYLGIGHTGKPDLALSGGALGALLAAPENNVFPAGLIRRCIGTIGTSICAAVFLGTGLVFIFLADWKCFLFSPAKKKGTEETPVPVAVPAAVSGEEPPSLESAPVKKSFLPLGRTKSETAPEVETPAAVISPEDKDLKNLRGTEKTGEEAAAAPVVPAEIPRPVRKATDDDPYTGARPQHAPSYSTRRTAMLPNNKPYDLPPNSLLDRPPKDRSEDNEHLDMAKATLQSTLDSFDISGTVSETIVGPRITRFEISLQPGVKVEKVTGIQNNIAKDMRAESIRILAPVPGRDTVGIELPNKVSNMVFIRELLESSSWKESRADIPIILGKDVSGKAMITDLAKAPHLLIAGSTGSGKSVCMNTLIMSLLYHFTPYDLNLILVDPKYVELEMYRPLPHLITPVVNDPTKVPYALRWGVNEMERRYQILARVKAKNLNSFNNRPPEQEPVLDEDGEVIPPKLPLLVIIVDELADIMMTEARKDVETSICRIAQKGRAAGIHLVIATQTPRKDIITGVIKANLPTKIAFKVSTGMDSRVILDAQGAEKLLGKGDMLFKGPSGETERIQGSMVSDPEIQKVVDFVSDQAEQNFDTTVILEHPEGEEEDDGGQNSFPDETFDDDGDGVSDYIKTTVAKYLEPGDDENTRKALEIILRENKASTSYLQRRMGIGYNKAAEIIDKLEQRGIVSAPLPGGQKRNILVFDELNRPDD